MISNNENPVSYAEAHKFLKVNRLLYLLPDFEENEKYADCLLNEIKNNFIYLIKEKQFYENFNHNLKVLRRYIKTYSLRFTKDDYLSIIELLYGVLIQKEIDVITTLNVITELKTLFKKSNFLSRDDLKIDWRPLYDIWYHFTHSSVAQNGIIFTPKSIKDPLLEVIQNFSKFFSKDSTESIWLLARPYLYYPYPHESNKHNGLKVLRAFLPFYYNNQKHFFEFVWPNLIAMLDMPTWMSNSEHDLMVLLGRAATTFVGLIDWTPYLDRFFTSLLWSLKIKVAGCSKRNKFNNTKPYVEILVYSIFGDDNCKTIEKFRLFFKAINHLYHPSSQAQNSSKLLNLLQHIASSMLNRYQMESVKKKRHTSIGNYPSEFYLTNGHIKNMTEILLPSCEFAIFTKSKSEYGAVLTTIQKLGSLCPEIIVPACLQLFHDTSKTVLEPHRTLSTLAIVSTLHVHLLNSKERYPEGKLAVFPLMRQLLSYININDPPKSYISVICFGNLANILWIEDLSDKANDPDLSPFEKEVAMATAQFEDLVLQFFHKLFEIIEIGFSESDMVESQKNSDFRAELLIDIIVMTIPNMSTSISKQVLDKTMDFVFSHSFLTESIQKFFAAIFGCILEREELAELGRSYFMTKYMRYFRQLLKDDCIILHEKVDIKLVWLTNLLPGFIKSNLLPKMVDDLLEILQTLSNIHCSDAHKLLNLLLTYCLNHCTSLSSTLNFIMEIKDKNFHLNSWSGLIYRSDLCSADSYNLPYMKPGEVEHRFLDNIISRFIVKNLCRLREITQIIKQEKTNEKIANKELRSICNLLTTVCECDQNYLENRHQNMKKEFLFDSSYKAVVSLPPCLFPKHMGPEKVLVLPNSDKSLLQDIKDTCLEAMETFFKSINNKNSVSHLPVTIKDLEDLFQLTYKCHDIHYGTLFSEQNKSFLDRRFDSFIDPVRRLANTALNWLLTLDDWRQRRFSCAQRSLTEEVIHIVDIFFSFLRQPHSSLQRKAVNCIYLLSHVYVQLDEYIIHKSLLLCNKDAPTLDEHTHSGLSQLLFKICENKSSFESMSFVYKLVPIFVSLGKSSFVDISSNRKLHSKLFDILVQLMSKYDLSDQQSITFDFSSIIRRLSSVTDLNKDSSHVKKKSYIIDCRKKLYFFCLDHCFQSFLSAGLSNDDTVPFVKSFLSYSLISTATWQSLYQMCTVLPLHTEIPIPIQFVELFFLILFSPSKELSSQGCNQINIMVWLLKRKMEKKTISPHEIGLVEQSAFCKKIIVGPRSDNEFLVIEKNINYWDLPANAKIKESSNGFLWWPLRMKIRYHLDKENELRCNDSCLNNEPNEKCWQLLNGIFESEEFHCQLRSFLFDLGSQFLREEENYQTSVQLLNLIHQFSLDQLIESIFICVGPSKVLPFIIKTYEELVSCTNGKQIYANKLAIQILSGILLSTKYWTSKQCRSFFDKELISLVDFYLEKASKSEIRLIGTSLIDLCNSGKIDVRQFSPIYRYFLNRLNELEHDWNKAVVCLNFVVSFAKNCGWRIGWSVIDDMCELWPKYVTSSSDKLRKESSRIIKFLGILHLLTNNYRFCSDEQKTAFLKFSSELKQMLASQTRIILLRKGLEPSIITMKALKLSNVTSIENEISDEESLDSSIQIISETTTPIDTPPNEQENGESEQEDMIADKAVSTIIQSLMDIYNKLGEFVSPELLRIFGICIDLIPIRDKIQLYTHLRHCALIVSNIFLVSDSSGSMGFEKINCSVILELMENAVKHQSWRVRLLAAKMMQIVSFTNMFIISRPDHLKYLVRLLFVLLTDSQIEVRKEASNMLSGLIQCYLYPVTSAFISSMCNRIKMSSVTSSSSGKITNEDLVQSHSGVLGLCAFIQAHPFDIPSNLPEVLTVLCSHINWPEPICSTIKETLARFKKSHQESWHIEREQFTEDQLCALTNVLVSPSYYA